MHPAADLADALIVRLQPVRDADLIVTLLDPDRGRVDAYARSARKSSRRFGGRLQLFALGRARLTQAKGGLPQLSEFERSADLAPTSVDWPLLCLCSTIAELAAVASQPEHADPELHRWACASLRACDDLAPSRLRLASLAVDLGFLQAVGSLPDVSRCSVCAGDLTVGATWEDANEGWSCLACRPTAGPTIDAAACAAVAALVLDPHAARTVFLSRRVGRLVRGHADALLADVLPRPLRTREPLREALALIEV